MDDAKRWYVMFAIVDPDDGAIVHSLKGPAFACAPYFCSGAKAVEATAMLVDAMAKLNMAIPLLDVFTRLALCMYRVRPR